MATSDTHATTTREICHVDMEEAEDSSPPPPCWNSKEEPSSTLALSAATVVREMVVLVYTMRVVVTIGASIIVGAGVARVVRVIVVLV